MFKFLKDKLQSFLGKKKPEKKAARKEKATRGKRAVRDKTKSSINTEIKTSKIAEEKPKEEKKSFFSRLFEKATSVTLTEEKFDELFQELEIMLLENNVALEIVDVIKESLKKELINKNIKKNDLEKVLITTLKKELSSAIQTGDLVEQIKKAEKPYVILFFGINGAGKTTTIAKLGHLLKKNKLSCVLAAGDTFRAASIEQLEIHANRLNIPLVKHNYGSDPAAVAFDAISYAKTRHKNVVLIDTAGRMYTKDNLMREMEKIVRISKANCKIFVGEATTGNDVLEQARTFNETAGIDGIILAKADVDEKGGAALSVSYITKKPLFFLGTGQNYDDLEKADVDTIINKLGLD